MTPEEKLTLESQRSTLRLQCEDAWKNYQFHLKKAESFKVTHSILQRQFSKVDMKLSVEDKLTKYNANGTPKKPSNKLAGLTQSQLQELYKELQEKLNGGHSCGG